MGVIDEECVKKGRLERSLRERNRLECVKAISHA